MSEITVTKKRSILKTLCKESKLFHVIAIIVLIVGAFFLDYTVAVWETKVFGCAHDYVFTIALYMIINAMGAFVVWVILSFLLRLLRSGISQAIALIHYCYLPLTEDEVRGKFTSTESYLRYMENELQYKEYFMDSTYIHYKAVTEDDIRKILQVCHKVFGSGSIFYGIYNNHSETVGIYELDGMRFVRDVSKKTDKFVHFMNRYMDLKNMKYKDIGQPFKEVTVINEDGTVTLSYSCKYGEKMNKVDTNSFTF